MTASHPAPLSARPGQLTVNWQWALTITWLLATVGLVVVAVVADNVGLALWWRGPQGDRASTLLMLAPFAAPIGACFAAGRQVRGASFIGIGAAIVTAGVAIGDISNVPGLAAVEFFIAGCGALVSAASLTGVYRVDPQPSSAAQN